MKSTLNPGAILRGTPYHSEVAAKFAMLDSLFGRGQSGGAWPGVSLQGLDRFEKAAVQSTMSAGDYKRTLAPKDQAAFKDWRQDNPRVWGRVQRGKISPGALQGNEPAGPGTTRQDRSTLLNELFRTGGQG